MKADNQLSMSSHTHRTTEPQNITIIVSSEPLGTSQIKGRCIKNLQEIAYPSFASQFLRALSLNNSQAVREVSRTRHALPMDQKCRVDTLSRVSMMLKKQI